MINEATPTKESSTAKEKTGGGWMGRLVRLLFGEPSTGFVRPIYVPEPPIRRMDCCPYCRAKLQSSKIIGVSRKGHVHADKREWSCGTMIRRYFFREVEVKIGSDCEPNAEITGG